MTWRYSGLALICLLVSLLPGTFDAIVRACAHPRDPVEGYNDVHEDAESVFARGEKLPLRCADVSTLEMIRGIADTLAFQLVATRERVQVAHERGESEVAALQHVHGVGPATAALLARYIRLEGVCQEEPHFEFLHLVD